MLRKLRIHGLAIIDRNEITFNSGLNVVTGETGAGKSILIKALSLLFGQKSSLDTIRSGETRAEVSAIFHLPSSHNAVRYLESVGVATENISSHSDNVELLIRRVITKKGRSSGFLNDSMVTLPTLKTLGLFLLDILGQSDHQKLYDPKNHQYYLDAFIKKEPLEKYRKVYGQVQNKVQAIKKLVTFALERSPDRDYLAFRKKELDEFSPSVEDYEYLFASLKEYELNFEKKKALEEFDSLLEGGFESSGVIDQINQLNRCAAELNSDKYESLVRQVAELNVMASDIAYQASRELSSLSELEVENSEGMQDRLAAYQAMMRRHHCETCNDLVVYHERLAEDLEKIDKAGLELIGLVEELATISKKLKKLADGLTSERRKGFRNLEKLVAAEFSDLSMQGAHLGLEFDAFKRETKIEGLKSLLEEDGRKQAEVAFQSIEHFGPDGQERVRLLLSANPGEPLMPLNRIASGGEASRIQLALKKVLSLGADTCVMVFDEIDTGISGKVADAVGSKLSSMSKDFQIICISHLAQVTCYADNHLRVYKQKSQSGRVESKIESMSEQKSLKELARLLSGGEITETSLSHATSLRKKALESFPSKSS